MKKKTTCLLGLICMGSMIMFTSGCAINTYPGGPSVGAALYVDVTAPAQMLTVATEPTAKQTKTGRATSQAVLGIAAIGDGGINKAMKNGGITKVHHIDHNIHLLLWGLYVSDTLIVHGE